MVIHELLTNHVFTCTIVTRMLLACIRMLPVFTLVVACFCPDRYLVPELTPKLEYNI